METKIMNNQLAMVKEFHAAFKLQMPHSFVDANDNVAELRRKLIEEEGHKEYNAADPMSVGLLDALVDTLYVTYGAFLQLGLKYTPAPLGEIYHNPAKASIAQEVLLACQELVRRPMCQFKLGPALHLLVHKCLTVAATNHFPIKEAFAAVHNANMKKMWTREELFASPQYKPYSDYETKLHYPATERNIVVYNEHGKVIKPASWQPADLNEFVLIAQSRFEQPAEPAPHVSSKSAAPASDPSPTRLVLRGGLESKPTKGKR